MPIIELEVRGLKEVLDKFKKIPQVFVREMSDAMWEIGYFIERMTKPLVPVDTGYLRRMTKVWEKKPLEVKIGSHTQYAVYIHEGTRFMVARPYFNWSLNKNKKAIEKTLNDKIKKLISM